jgi:hypothetical protein
MPRIFVMTTLIGVIFLSMFGGWFNYAQSISNPYQEKVEIGEPFGLCHAGYSCSDDEYDLLDSLGNQWIRIDLSWTRVEPKSDVWDFSYYDQYLQKANQRGQKIMAILDYGHPKLNNSNDFYIAPEQIPYFLEYVNRTVTRYRFNVSAFEIWNEPNFDFWRGTDSEYFNLFNQTVELIYSIDPNIFVLGPGMAGFSTDYLEKMFELGITTHLDAISFHPYSAHPDSLYQRIYDIKQLANKYDYKGEIWITEVGNPTGGIYGHSVSLGKQADRLIKTLTYSTILDVRNIIWYCLFDSPESVKENNPLNSESFFGIVYPDNNTWKPAAHTFKIMSNQISNSHYYPNAIRHSGLIGQSIRSFLFRNAQGKTTIVLWVDEGSATNSEVKLKLTIPNNSSPVIMHDIYSNNTKTASSLELNSFSINTTPFVFSYQTNPDNQDIIQIEYAQITGWHIYIIGIPALLAIVILIRKR